MSLKDRIHRKEITLGSWITLGHPAIGEIMAGIGFDWLTIDLEHSAITLGECQQLIQVIELRGCVPLVRVGENDPTVIKRVMDAGAHGVIVPMVNSRADAEQAVKSVKYPPAGFRGVGYGRAQGYGLHFEAYRDWNARDTLVVVQIEHIRAVEQMAEILTVPGVDAFIVGPYDLSASLGIPGEFSRPEFLRAMEQIRTTMGDFPGVAPGFHAVQPSPDDAVKKLEEGYRFLAYSLDTLILGGTLQRDLRTIGRGKWKPLPPVKGGTR
ncbi:MAG: aldolase/citrate lyase family protein [Methanomicrobiales archaeon]|nr:aldolase/citrate lyase family protein [Methanomicrobiales archaeon]